MSLDRKAFVSMAENIMLKRVGARAQPCLTPCTTWKGSEDVLLDSCLHSIMEFVDHVDKDIGTAKR